MGEERHSRIRKYVENKPQRLKLLCRRLFFFLTFHVAGGGRCCLRAIVTLGLLFLSCRIVLEHYFLQFMRYTFFFFLHFFSRLFLPPNSILNYHKLSGLKQYLFIGSQSIGQKSGTVCLGSLVLGAQNVARLKSRCQTACFHL